MSRWKASLGAVLLYFYYLLLLRTVRFTYVGREDVLDDVNAGRTSVFAVPHFSLLAAALSWDGHQATFLASLSRDGELAARLFERRGFRMVRGSSSRGGREALADLLLRVRSGEPVGITFDGPRGPALKPKAGVAVLAQAASGRLFLVCVRPLRSRWLGRPLVVRLRSWDRFLLPLPFARLEIVHEVVDPSGVMRSEGAAWVSAALEELERRARVLGA